MGRAVRVGLVVLGAAMAVYSTASLTGGWLGTPPWWEIREAREVLRQRRLHRMFPESSEQEAAILASGDPIRIQNLVESVGPTDVREIFDDLTDATTGERYEGSLGITLCRSRRLTSAAVAALGAGLVAAGVWRRHKQAVGAAD